jgi:hypothetical protein
VCRIALRLVLRQFEVANELCFGRMIACWKASLELLMLKKKILRFRVVLTQLRASEVGSFSAEGTAP